MNKKIYILMFILFSFFISTNLVKAEQCVYQTAVSYADADVLKECYESYNSALNFMNTYKSTEKEVAIILKNNKIINAKYAIAKIDVENETVITKKGNDGLKTIYSSSYEAYKAVANSSTKNNLAFIASTWGSDAAFIEYDKKYDTVRIKISGVDGWIKKSQVIIIPTSKFYNKTFNYPDNKPKIKANTNGVTLRKTASTTGEAINGASSQSSQEYEFFPSKTIISENYTWYYVKVGNNYGYYANNGTWFTDISKMQNDTYYYTKDKTLYHRIHKGENYYDVTITLGSAPFEYSKPQTKSFILTENKRHYSFDGNYYYNNYKDMIDDYRVGNYNKSINNDNPYYPYFMYLPSRSKTSYTADQFNQLIINKGYTSFPINPKSYVNTKTGTISNYPQGTSMMFGIGSSLLEAQNTYGTNALIIYGNAVRESGNGTSAIAFYKNNLFGIGAYDGNAFNAAKSYNSVADGVKDYSRLIGYGSAFSDIEDYRYNGTHEGNKLSGKGVRYATDPYSGESTTSFVYTADKSSGNIDEFSNTIGIKNNNKIINIYAEPNETSRVIYQTKNYLTGKVLTNLPFSIIDYKDGFYKVYTDLSLNSDRVFDKTKFYDFDVSYGYIKKEDLYVRNNAPIINAEDQTIEAGSEFKYTPTATDYEAGNITSKILADKEIDTSIPATHKITYSVLDNENLKTYKTITVTVTSPNTSINVESIEIPQYIEFDPLENVTASDYIDGDITNNIIVEGTVNTNVMGEYTLTYSVTNSENKKTTIERKVTVIENKRPIISAINRTIYLNDNFNYMYNVKANDYEDGNLTSKITYTGSVDSTKVGSYPVKYKVYDSVRQETTKDIIITVEEKEFIKKDSLFHLENLSVKNKLFNLTGFLVIKGMSNTKDVDIKYDVIFRNQTTNDEVIMPLSRLLNDIPFNAPNDAGFKNTGAWFNGDLDLSVLDSGDYTVFVRARSKDFESTTVLKNLFYKNIVKKVEIDNIGYLFKTNYYSKQIPLELFVRKDGLASNKNNPTHDNMFNQVFDIKFDESFMEITGTSHNVNGNYGLTQEITRELYLENIETKEVVKKYSVGSISNGPYQVSLKVSDGLSKTRVWYKKSLDLTSIPKGHYSINLRTKTGNVDDFGELYDILFLQIGKSHNYNGRKYTIVRNNELRYRIELIIE